MAMSAEEKAERHREEARAYYWAHREEIKRKNAERYQNNLEAERAKARKYYLAHIDERREYDKSRYDERRESQAAYRREWRKKNEEEIKARAKAYRTTPQARKVAKDYYWANRDKLLAKNKAWRDANPEDAKERDLRRKCARFGITVEHFWRIYADQDGKCAICLTEELDLDSRRNLPRALAIDHDHDTGEVRGLLCGMCNKGIGAFADNPDLMRRAVLYLEDRGN